MAVLLKELSPDERMLRIKFSRIAGALRGITAEAGFEWAMNSDYLSKSEKDYILFHINNLEEIQNMNYILFKEKVEKYKLELENAENI
jgi:hypothetical protein